MKRRYLCIVILITICFSLTGLTAEINQDNFPDSGATKMIYGEKHVFTVITPANWVTDTDAEMQSGIPYLIRPDNAADWNNVYIYALGFDKPDNSRETIKTFVAGDVKDFKRNHPGIKIKKLDFQFENIKNSKTLSGKYFIHEFSSFDDTYKEITVYIEFPQGVGTLVFSAKTQEAYEEYFNAFIGLVHSFQFIAASRPEADGNTNE
jgi:hypothetical protein